MMDNVVTSKLTVDSQHPYLGLESYREEYKDYFFGRSRDKEQLVKLIRRNTVTILSGESGLGKTSLIKAGIIPNLRELDLLPIYVRLDFDHTEGNEVLASLKSSINQQCQQIDPSLDKLKDQTLWQYFHTAKILNGFVVPVLIFDQFEELFTRGSAYPEETQQLLNELIDLVENQIPLSVQDEYQNRQIPFNFESQNYHILFSLREDYLPKLESLSTYMPSIKKSRYRLVQMTEEQALEAIASPGKAIINQKEARKILQLIYTAQVENAESRKKQDKIEIEPFLLSLICFHINNLRILRKESKITNELLRNIEVKNIIDKFYSDAVASLSPKACSALEEQLLTKDGFRKLQPKNDLIQTGLIKEVDIELLVNKRILRKEIWSGREHVEWIHDILVPVTKDRLKKSRATKNKRRRLIYAASVLLTAVFLSSAIWGIVAHRQKKKTEINYELAQRRADSLVLLTKELDRLKQLAVSERDTARTYRSKAEEQEDLAQKQKLLAEGRLNKIMTDDNLEKKRTIDRLEELKDLTEGEKWRAENIISNVTTYLWLKEDQASLDTLVNLLKAYEAYIPVDYGLVTPEDQFVDVQDSINWPLTLTYNPNRRFNWNRYTYNWQTFSRFIARRWGIPTPWKIRFVEDDNLPEDQMMISSPGEENLIYSPPEKKDYVLVTKYGLKDPRARAFFKANQAEWELLEEITNNGPWYLVPRWTQPIFKVAGHSTSPAEVGTALIFANELLENPRFLLNEDVLKILLGKVSKRHPSTVQEALQNRGGIEGLRKDLNEIVLDDNGMPNLEYYLDFLADEPVDDPIVAASRVEEAILTNEMTAVKLYGKSGLHLNIDSIISVQNTYPYQETIQYLPDFMDDKIRIYLGSANSSSILNHKGKLRTELLEVLDGVRYVFSRRFGIVPPSIKFRLDDTLPVDEMRIEFLNQDSTNELAQNIKIKPNIQEFHTQISDEVFNRSVWFRIYWITPDYVTSVLNRLPTKLKARISQSYSITDFKNILRAVIRPDQKEMELYDQNRDDEALENIPNENTLYNVEWLLKSITFWRHTRIDTLSLEDVREALINTQRARLKPDQFPAVNSNIGSLIEQGIEKLEDSNIKEAERFFKEAVAQNQNEAIASFLNLYPTYATLDIKSILANPLVPGELNRTDALTLEELRNMEMHYVRNEGRLSDDEKLNTLTLMLNSYLDKQHFIKSDVIVHRIIAIPDQEKWSLGHKFLTGYLFLKNNIQFKEAPQRLLQITNLLTESLSNWEDEKVAGLYYDIIKLIGEEYNSMNWSTDLLIDLSHLYPNNFWVNYYTGNHLINKVQYKYSEEALIFLGRAKKVVPDDDHDRLLAWLDKDRGWAYYKMAGFTDKPDWQETKRKGIEVLEELLSRIENKPTSWPQYKDIYSILYSLYRQNNNFDKAESLIEEALSKDPENASYLQQKVFTLLAKGDIIKALTVAEQVPKKGNDYLFDLSVTQILNNHTNSEYTANKFFDTDQVYQDYIRMLLFYYLASNGNLERGLDILKKRWKLINRAKWDLRLENGDDTVLGEMLIGFYLNEVDGNLIFGPLASKEIFEQHPFSKNHSFKANQCEAFFYKALYHASMKETSKFNEALDKVLATEYYSYYEYHMAKILDK